MTKVARQSNIELLRSILMFMVIVLHYNNPQMGGGFAYATGASMRFLQLAETLSVCAVNCFVLISAYFLSGVSRRSVKKAASLLGMVIGYRLLGYALQVCLTGVPFRLKTLIGCFIPNNWFVILFCVLYYISVYINPLFDALEKKQLQQCVLLCLVFFVVYPTFLEGGISILTGSAEIPGIGTVTMNGSADGYTIVNFVVLYLIGGYLRKYPVSFTQLQCIVIFGIVTICNFVLGMFSSVYTSYSNLFVVIQAVTLFLIFLKCDMKYYPIVNFISKSAFGIYLWHTSSFMIVDFWGYFQIPKYCRQGLGSAMLHLILSCLAMYLACLMVDIIRRYTFSLVRWAVGRCS